MTGNSNRRPNNRLVKEEMLKRGRGCNGIDCKAYEVGWRFRAWVDGKQSHGAVEK